MTNREKVASDIRLLLLLLGTRFLAGGGKNLIHFIEWELLETAVEIDHGRADFQQRRGGGVVPQPPPPPPASTT